MYGPYEEVTVQEIREAYQKMKKGRAAGRSEVCTVFWREINCRNIVCEVVVNKLLVG